MNTVSDKEKHILEAMDYANKYLCIKNKYIGDGKIFWLYKKKDVLQVFKELGYNVKYITGGAYFIEKYYNNYRFDYSFVISQNNFSIYLYIYIDNVLIENRVSNMGYILKFLPYDVKLANKLNESGFVLESLDDMKNYIQDIINLFDEFINKYEATIKYW
ncbi:hypothetical protein FACS189429_6450 [Bacteroidia bacterium]|nr:hypothetical protein FACS189429_6450 [Bacteroidia bacterium]